MEVGALEPTSELKFAACPHAWMDLQLARWLPRYAEGCINSKVPR